ncbi:DUF4190 domain-containing protein [Streptomyces sp. Da 82-17]|uniref:DUF4190 domain-containing protein n=1 Tax=Streptomyces sp. Da 82-17 TaxID=3377116 RepID=UPI0038D50F07
MPPPQGWQQPYPYGPAPTTNGLAVTSMVLGILCILPPLGLVLGLVALSQIKRTGQRGKGMAVAGVTLSSIGTAFIVLALSLGWAASFWGGFTGAADDGRERRSAFSLAEGDCFDSVSGSLDDLDGVTTRVDIVDCAGPHDAEVYGNFQLEGGSYPGDTGIAQRADERCGDLGAAYFGDASALPADAEESYFYPDSRAWAQGERGVTCMVGARGAGKLTGSVRDGASGGAGGGSTGGDSTGGSTGGSGGDSTGGSTSGSGGGSTGGASGGSTGGLDGQPGEGAEV